MDAAPPDVRFGRGLADDLGPICAAAGWTRPIAITSPSRRFVDRLAPDWRLVPLAAEHGPAAILEQALGCVRDADALVAIGGGSAIGLCKALGHRTGLPIAFVPTTFAGSALTDRFGISEAGRKRVLQAPDAMARLVLYDPALFDGFVGPAAAASAFNAIAHIVDAALGGAPLEVLEPLPALAAMLPRAIAGPCDAGVRAASAAAATLARHGAGAHHRLCHLLGGRFGTAHGQTHAILLPHMIALHAATRPEAVAEIGRRLDSADPALTLQQLAGRCGIGGGLRALGVPEAALADLVRDAAGLGLQQAGLAGAINRAWSGDQPKSYMRLDTYV